MWNNIVFDHCEGFALYWNLKEGSVEEFKFKNVQIISAEGEEIAV